MFYPHPRTIWQPEKQSNSYSVWFKLAITRAFSAARRVSTTSSNSWSSAFLFIVTDTAIQTPDFFANWINDEIPWRLSDYSRNTPALSPHLLSVLSLGGQRADVGPAQLLHNLHHGLGLQPNHCNSDYILHFTFYIVISQPTFRGNLPPFETKSSPRRDIFQCENPCDQPMKYMGDKYISRLQQKIMFKTSDFVC